MINRGVDTPIYLQIAYMIRDKIVNKEYQKNDKIPAEDDLAKQFGVSRMTARNAVTYLVNEGLVYRVHGKGAFVSNRKLNRNLNKLNNFHQDIEELGMKPTSKVLEFNRRLPSQKEQKILVLQKNQEVFDVKRIRYVDDEPLGIQNFIVPVRIVPSLPEVDLENGSFYKYLEEVGYPLDKAEQRMESILAPEIARIIGVAEEKPFFYFERLSFTKQNIPVELLHSYFYGEKYSFNITLHSDK